MQPQYKPSDVEKKWYTFWMNNGFNHSTIDAKKQSFTIVIPPPNITGALHMGHALNNVIQDMFVRFQKMSGKNTCWIPGTDHGGIATQNVIEKQLKQKGMDRHTLGREKFLEMMWQWRRETGDTILMQLRTLGCLCDWDRTRFTMDEQCSRAVFTAFKTLYDKGLIYRGNYMVNWCPRCHTALSDIEVEYEEKNGSLWHIQYPFKDNPDVKIIVATTRPETMLGDTAVAVNPDDERYKNIIGKHVILPIMNRAIPVIADAMVEKEFGTGAVKITPAHDPNDYETAKRHNLPHVVVIDKKGMMTDEAGAYAGMERYACRKKLVEDLEAIGALVKTEPYKNKVGVCYRCNTIIEPLASEQWYLSTKEMAQRALKKQVQFIPENWEKPYRAWLENLHDWCISRQIWWGHRIPVWYCDTCNHTFIPSAFNETPHNCPECNSTALHQDEDVLDTWFSSALWPFSTLGWPDHSEELRYYYPTSVLATGHEILYLWVARMIMMGLTFMNDVPFKTVYIHGIVRDAKGKKMSKSLGNVIDPLDIIAQYGTDALRFTLASHGIMGRDLQLANETFASSRNFCNKLWNASRFVLTNLEKLSEETGWKPTGKLALEASCAHRVGFNVCALNVNIDATATHKEIADAWIVGECNATWQRVLDAYQQCDFAHAARLMYDFTWSTFCDWYLELAKLRLYGSDNEQKKIAFEVLLYVLKHILLLLHPVMPFITEEIFEKLNAYIPSEKSILLEQFSSHDTARTLGTNAATTLQRVTEIVSSIRNIRNEMNVPASKDIALYIRTPQSALLDEQSCAYIQHLLRMKTPIEQSESIAKPPQSATALVQGYELFVPLTGLIDLDKEKERLTKKIATLAEEIKRCDAKLLNENFTTHAPREEVEKVTTKKQCASDELVKAEQNLNDLR